MYVHSYLNEKLRISWEEEEGDPLGFTRMLPRTTGQIPSLEVRFEARSQLVSWTCLLIFIVPRFLPFRV